MNTIAELIEAIYEDNYSHLDFMDNMTGGDCDCNINYALNLIAHHAGLEKE